LLTWAFTWWRGECPIPGHRRGMCQDIGDTRLGGVACGYGSVSRRGASAVMTRVVRLGGLVGSEELPVASDCRGDQVLTSVGRRATRGQDCLGETGRFSRGASGTARQLAARTAEYDDAHERAGAHDRDAEANASWRADLEAPHNAGSRTSSAPVAGGPS